MIQELLEQLEAISQEIEAHDNTVMDRLIDRMAKLTLGEDAPEDDWESEEAAPLTLRAFRIRVLLDLIAAGERAYAADFKKDFEQALDSVKRLTRASRTDARALSNTVDLVLLADPDKREFLLRQLDFLTRRKITRQAPLEPMVFFAAMDMMLCCLGNGMEADGCVLGSNLILLSQERNQAEPRKHREVVRRVLEYLVDIDRELTCQICDQQWPYFEDADGLDAGMFFYFYGFALSNTGQTETSIAVLEHAHDLLLEAQGPRSWFAARAGQMFHYYIMATEHSQESEDYLWDVIQKTEDGYYRDMTPDARLVAGNARGLLLDYHIGLQTLRTLPDQVRKHLDFCRENEDQAFTSLMTVRYAENAMAAYHTERCEYLQAAQHTINALNAPSPDHLEVRLTDDLLYSNLLLIYSQMNDLDQMYQMLELISDVLDRYGEADSSYYRLMLLVNTTYKRLGIPSNVHEDGELDFLRSFYDALSKGDWDPEEDEYEDNEASFAAYTLDCMATVMDANAASAEELDQYLAIIDHLLRHPKIYRLNDAQMMLVYMTQAQIYYHQSDRRALDSLGACLRLSSALVQSHEGRITVLRFAALVYHGMRRHDLALEAVYEALECITASWQNAATYLNDHKICALLAYVQANFQACFSVLRISASPEELYQRVLQFKALPSLVGRERNRLLQLEPIDLDLRSRIFQLQDRIAAAQLTDSLQGTNTTRELDAQLQRLEAEFAEQFPQNVQFTEITFDGVCRVLEEDAAIVEYYFSYDKEGRAATPGAELALELDIFITRKEAGQPSLCRLRVPNAQPILDAATTFVDILQHPDDIARSREKITLRAELYRQLLSPVMSGLDGVRTLYIAPDQELCNLPFEILQADGSGLLQDRFRVCRLVCGRDLLFRDGSSGFGGTPFILGDPDYEAELGPRTISRDRAAHKDLKPVQALPFSGIEARRISRRCRTWACTGPNATKYALQQALPCGIIHLATHGAFDADVEGDSLYSSYLIFAGYNKWVTRKTESEACGNGVLTADEISRMNLRSTELVVLSACQSGLSDTSFGNVQGLLSAFSAAGVRWVISHMWHASDFATSVLMDAFYDAYLTRGMDVPDALQYAREYLRTVTVGQLRMDGWFDTRGLGEASDAQRRQLEAYSRANDRRRLFADEFYWGGFVAHKCK